MLHRLRAVLTGWLTDCGLAGRLAAILPAPLPCHIFVLHPHTLHIAAPPPCRLAYWQQLPCVSYPELQCLREGTPYQPESPTAATAGAPQAAAAAAAVVGQYVAPAVEVALRGDGGLAASSSPQLHHPLTGEALSLHLPLDSAHSFSADRLLLQAAAHTAGIQLAAVQAALQRGGRLAPAGIHSELALAASSAATACGQLPASPMLQLWHAGSLQLSVSVQLRSGRLLLAAGPALLESEQGGAAAAAAAATQQQLDQLHRGAMVQPLPTGASRGMLAVQLAADALARLSLQLSMQRRMDAAAAAAAAYGLRRASLPGRLLQQHLQHVALLLAPLSGNTLTLALPAHPPPSDLAQWACQQRQRRQQQQGGGSDSGATRCFMLLDFGETPAVAGQQQQQEQDAAVSRQPGQALRVLLAACACTSRGTPTRVLQVSELPPEELREMQQEAAAPPVPSSAASRKRRASDAAAPAAGGKQVVAATGSEAELGLAAAVAWCKRQSSWAALKAQLLLIPAQHGEELGLTAPHRQALLLPKLPGFAQLEPWAAARLGSCSGSSGGGEQQPIARPAARLQLEEGEASGGEMGAWRVHTSSLYFAHLRRLLQPLGVTAAPPAPDAQHMATTQDGLELRYSLQTGTCAPGGWVGRWEQFACLAWLLERFRCLSRPACPPVPAANGLLPLGNPNRCCRPQRGDCPHRSSVPRPAARLPHPPGGLHGSQPTGSRHCRSSAYQRWPRRPDEWPSSQQQGGGGA